MSPIFDNIIAILSAIALVLYVLATAVVGPAAMHWAAWYLSSLCFVCSLVAFRRAWRRAPTRGDHLYAGAVWLFMGVGMLTAYRFPPVYH